MEGLLANKMLKEKLGEILGEKMTEIFQKKIKDNGLKKFSWTFEVVGDELICVKTVQQFEGVEELKVTQPNLNVKQFISDAMKGGQ